MPLILKYDGNNLRKVLDEVWREAEAWALVVCLRVTSFGIVLLDQFLVDTSSRRLQTELFEILARIELIDSIIHRHIHSAAAIVCFLVNSKHG